MKTSGFHQKWQKSWFPLSGSDPRRTRNFLHQTALGRCTVFVSFGITDVQKQRYQVHVWYQNQIVKRPWPSKWLYLFKYGLYRFNLRLNDTTINMTLLCYIYTFYPNHSIRHGQLSMPSSSSKDKFGIPSLCQRVASRVLSVLLCKTANEGESFYLTIH